MPKSKTGSGYVRGQVPKVLKEIVSLSRGPSELLVCNIVRWTDGSIRFDCRGNVQTQRYAGPTRRGVGFKREELTALFERRDEILAAFDEAEARETERASREPAKDKTEGGGAA